MPLSLASKRDARILIIDDEPAVLSVVETMLGQSHRCKTATSALEAIEYLKEQPYDLVLSTMKDATTGIDLRYLLLTMTGDRTTGSWRR